LKIRATPRFKRAYKKLSSSAQAAVDQALRRFVENPRNPGLHFEKLQHSDYRTIRVGLGIRIVLRGEDSEFDLVDIGGHDSVDRNYG
jgi:mRNA-degrading endonuclease RelE of RelBE toxin-antitoxin system